MKKNLLFSIVFIGISFIIFFILNNIKTNAINEYLQTKTQNYKENYHALYNEHKVLSEVIFITNINTDKILTIFKDAKTSTDKEKQDIRDKLYSELVDIYSILVKYNIKQLHFHLPNNESFLRFHRPNKYGDDLTSVRETVNYVNTTQKPIDGFEEGKIYNAYRFVFPLFYHEIYLGSVEVSFSTLSMSLDFIHDYKKFAHFLILKENIEKKVFNDEKINYISSAFSDFSIEKKELQTLKKYMDRGKVNLSQITKEIINNTWREKASISIYDKNINKVMTFIKVIHPVTDKVIGLFMIKSDAIYINNIENTYIISLIILNLFIFFILLLIYIELNYRVAIESKNKTLSSILNEADSGIALMDLNGKFLKVNQVYSKILGYSKDELLKLSCIDITKYNSALPSNKILETARVKGSVSKIRKVCMSKDSKEINLEFSLTLLPTKDAFIAVINPFNDKIELETLNKSLENRVNQEIIKNQVKEKRLQEQARFAQMGEMISMIAHQWRQPLSAISSSIIDIQIKQELGRYNLELKEDRALFLELLDIRHKAIQKYVVFLTDTIDDFRDMFKSNKQKELVLISLPIKKSLEIIENTLISKNIELSCSFNSDDKVLIYKNEIMQVLINILNNSKDNFLLNDVKEAHITICTKENKNSLIICIRDNGGGISEDIITSIFDPYFSTKSEKNGTGLGLYMSKIIIEEHNNGSLEVENINNGVEFRIVIPRSIDV